MAESELTTLQTILNDLLDRMDVAHEDEHYVWAGGHLYKLDAFLPDYYAYIEADGDGIHHSRRADDLRDTRLMREGLVGLHLSKATLQDSPSEVIVVIIRTFLENAEETATGRRGKRRGDAFAAFRED